MDLRTDNRSPTKSRAWMTHLSGAVVGLLLATACGAGSTDRSDANAVASDFFNAWTQGDIPRLEGLATEGFRETAQFTAVLEPIPEGSVLCLEADRHGIIECRLTAGPDTYYLLINDFGNGYEVDWAKQGIRPS